MNTKKTLADVQPGGRVRLGDGPWPEIDAILADAYSAGAEGLPFEGIARRAAVRKAVAALSAQPSPGGQGDALLKLKVAWMKEANDRFQANEFSVVAERLYICINELEAALAARQPVGEPVAYMVRWKTEGGFGLEWPKNMQYFRDRADEYEIVPLQLAAPPAQAVDLEQFRPAVCAMGLYAEEPEDVDEAKRLLALIDSQAVGEPVVTAEMLAAADKYHDSDEYRSGQFSDSHTNAACYRAMAAVAPPAQAVDLERFRPAVMTALGLSSPYGLERETLNELLDLIDSQAVGK
ncbi:hypothetical protein [Stenotrophomonas beteli]|uniref:Uncharacterized protein n=1 Tax=Stenotrophomonas beteli TaxID=3384461 RepID=A0A0R0B4E0_9GAMM|nr:hypothetical protein [Stenotrophomonas maltophilia]KRG49314.1 hypothetical protein ARC23_14610 [Stenotrophomonas maltophilia]